MINLEKFVPELLGKKGSKMGFFGFFSKTTLTNLFIFLQKEDIMVLHIYANFQAHKNFSFRDIGKKWVKSGGIRLFHKK